MGVGNPPCFEKAKGGQEGFFTTSLRVVEKARWAFYSFSYIKIKKQIGNHQVPP